MELSGGGRVYIYNVNKKTINLVVRCFSVNYKKVVWPKNEFYCDSANFIVRNIARGAVYSDASTKL